MERQKSGQPKNSNLRMFFEIGIDNLNAKVVPTKMEIIETPKTLFKSLFENEF
jgi:hypothetical protein